MVQITRLALFLIPLYIGNLKSYAIRFIDYVSKETLENRTKIVLNVPFDNHLEVDYMSLNVIKLETYMRTHMRTYMRIHIRTHMSFNLIQLEI